ncbi:serine hydrolase domain-containing protein [Janibacter sp. GXQ6167]|uniref:serine hydrolase domain-containing protein n=1 Tax=Janibacter sp. GXQ6167 TaxID=3240791 RepID=UPI003524E198
MTQPTHFSPETEHALDLIAATTQREGRVPGLAAAIARKGQIRWFRGIGSADLAHPGVTPDADTQYPVASNTKLFTAVVIMALRDEGRLDLDDPISRHLPGIAHGHVTIRQLLSHISGMQREPVGEVWRTLEMPDADALVSGWAEASQVGRPHHHWHYSNLGYAMLGQVIERLDGQPWFTSVKRRILDPLGLTRTTLGPAGRRATGYHVPPWTDVPVPEPDLDLRATAPAGALASTASDLATWGGFIANPSAEILHPDTLEEMLVPQTMADPATWSQAWGLGFMLVRREDRLWVGHTGGFPGAVTGFLTERASATTSIVLMNTSSPGLAQGPALVSAKLGTVAVEREPVVPEPWIPGTDVPAPAAEILGHWWSEGSEFVFSVREGRLEARAIGAPATTPPSVFTLEAEDTWRTVSGREAGELLLVRRDPAGAVSEMSWATYPFTREPAPFGPA